MFYCLLLTALLVSLAMAAMILLVWCRCSVFVSSYNLYIYHNHKMLLSCHSLTIFNRRITKRIQNYCCNDKWHPNNSGFCSAMHPSIKACIWLLPAIATNILKFKRCWDDNIFALNNYCFYGVFFVLSDCRR